MKKYITIFFLVISFICLKQNAFASVSPSLGQSGDNFNIVCKLQNNTDYTFFIFSPDNALYTGGTCGIDNATPLTNFPYEGKYNIVYCLNDNIEGDCNYQMQNFYSFPSNPFNLNDIKLLAGYSGIDQLTIVPQTSLGGGGILFGRDSNNQSSANNLMASVGNATQATFGSLGGVFAVILGIIIAFIGIEWITNLLKKTDEKHKIKH